MELIHPHNGRAGRVVKHHLEHLISAAVAWVALDGLLAVHGRLLPQILERRATLVPVGLPHNNDALLGLQRRVQLAPTAQRAKAGIKLG